jgi:hypothetical protein
MKLIIQIFFLLIFSATFAFSDDLRHPSTLNSFCVDPARDELCADFPDDQTDFSDKFVYMFINVETQAPFDIFSWQGFTSLNWQETGLSPEASPTNWTNFSRREQVFNKDLASQNCSAHAKGAEVITSNLVQADGNILIDQNGNFIVYETRINPAAEAYILTEMLDKQSGHTTRNDAPISFPQGRLGTDATPASVIVKTSWQVMTPDTDQSQYIVKNGLIFVPASHSESGQDMCITEKLGMVGMHIVSRIDSGNGDEWLWSTYEHNLTVPDAGNSRRVNAIFSRDLFPGGCSKPETDTSKDYIFYNSECPDCPPVQPILEEWHWADAQPYARIGGTTDFQPPQIVRCWSVFEGTSELNEIWQKELHGTPLANYQLISTQWRGADRSPMFEHGEVPRFLTNTTMETYLQAANEGTCLGCHASAVTPTDADANFTFLFENVQKE